MGEAGSSGVAPGGEQVGCRGWSCVQRRMKATVSWFHVDTGFGFLENLFFGRCFVLFSLEGTS